MGYINRYLDTVYNDVLIFLSNNHVHNVLLVIWFAELITKLIAN